MFLAQEEAIVDGVGPHNPGWHTLNLALLEEESEGLLDANNHHDA